MRGCASFRNEVILPQSKHRHASLLSKSRSRVPLKVTAITLLGGPDRSSALQMAPPFAIFNKHQPGERHPGAANKRNAAIKMASSCSEPLRRVPRGWLHLGGVRVMLMLRLFDSDGAVKKAGACEIPAVSPNCSIT